MNKITHTSIKLTGLVLALVVGLICGLAGPFLSVWLGPDFQNITWVLVLMVFPLSTNLIMSPFFNIHVSLNKLKIPSLVILVLGLLNLLLAILLAPRYGVMGIVLASALTLTLNYSFFSPVYAAKIMNLSWWHYLQRLGVITLVTMGVTLVSYFIDKTIPLTSYQHLIFAGGLVSLVYLILVYLFGLTEIEKDLLKSFLSRSNYQR